MTNPEYTKRAEALAAARKWAAESPRQALIEQFEYLDKELREWWITAAKEFLLNFHGINLAERQKNWKSYRYVLNNEPFGTIVVEEYQADEMAPDVLVETWTVKKSEILNADAERILADSVAAAVEKFGVTEVLRRLNTKAGE